jgi:hypothetical protein
VAHSYGGHVATVLSQRFSEDFKQKVFAVGFTDSVHSSAGSRISEIGVNFVSSSEPLGTVLNKSRGGMPLISAGTPKHEMTSYSCMENLFDFLNERYQAERGSQDQPDAKKPKTEEL